MRGISATEPPEPEGNASHTYGTAGNYTWTFNATDAIGDSIAEYGLVTVYRPLGVEISVGPALGLAPLNVSFNATPEFGEAPYRIVWAFGDGSPNATTAAVWHTYETAANYTATVTVTDAAGVSAVRSVPVVVVSPMTVLAGVSPLLGQAPFRVAFTASPSGGLAPFSFAWVFGPGLGTSSASSGTFDFVSAGNFTVGLTVQDSLNETYVRSFSVEVVRPLGAALSVSREAGVAPLATNLTLVVQGGLAPLWYLWSFGDGTVGTTGPAVSHTFATVGRFDVRATVTDSLGSDVVTNATVLVVHPLSVTLTANTSTVTIGGSVALTLAFSGGLAPLEVRWSGLPSGCASENVTQLACSPNASGKFTVSATVSDALGESTTESTSLAVLSNATTPGTGGGGASSASLWEDAALGLVVLLVAIAVVAVVLRGRRPGPPTEPEGPSGEPSESTPGEAPSESG